MNEERTQKLNRVKVAEKERDGLKVRIMFICCDVTVLRWFSRVLIADRCFVGSPR